MADATSSNLPANVPEARHRSRFSGPQYDDTKTGTFLRIADRFGVATAVLCFVGVALWIILGWAAHQVDWLKEKVAIPVVTAHVDFVSSVNRNTEKQASATEKQATASEKQAAAMTAICEAVTSLQRDAEKMHRHIQKKSVPPVGQTAEANDGDKPADSSNQ